MKTATGSHVFNGEVKSLFIAENCLVFRAVIHKYTADFFHLRHGKHIHNDNYRTQKSFKKRVELRQRIGKAIFVDNIDKVCGQKNEQRYD